MQADVRCWMLAMPTLAKNSKALHDYTILEKFEAGIVLTGAEVKSAKGGSINLKGSFVDVRGNEAVLKNMHIALYKAAGKDDNYNPTHDRKLLLKAREMKRLLGKREAERLTIVPLSVYTT